ncbi:MAG: FAD-dependent oxidoreductase, partial [Hyphomonas sp.]
KSVKDGVELTVEPSAGGAAETIKGDVVLVAIGRRPYTEGLGLESVGVTPDKRGFIDHDHFKVADGVWVIGDVTHGPMLAHKAEEEGVALAEMLAGQAGHVNYDVIPWVIYTSPEIAWAGLTEKQAKDRGLSIKTGQFPFSANGRALGHGDTRGFVKIIADAQTDKLLGVHMIGGGVSELIGEVVAIMEFGGSSEDLA